VTAFGIQLQIATRTGTQDSLQKENTNAVKLLAFSDPDTAIAMVISYGTSITGAVNLRMNPNSVAELTTGII